MLNAGNELVAEEAGWCAWPRSPTCCGPYLGTVTAVAGPAAWSRHGPWAGRWRPPSRTSGRIGRRRGRAEAAARLDVSPALARRYVDRLRDPHEGLLPEGVVDPAALETVAALRRRFVPEHVDGADVLDRPLDAVLGEHD